MEKKGISDQGIFCLDRGCTEKDGKPGGGRGERGRQESSAGVLPSPVYCPVVHGTHTDVAGRICYECSTCNGLGPLLLRLDLPYQYGDGGCNRKNKEAGVQKYSHACLVQKSVFQVHNTAHFYRYVCIYQSQRQGMACFAGYVSDRGSGFPYFFRENMAPLSMPFWHNSEFDRREKPTIFIHRCSSLFTVRHLCRSLSRRGGP